ncbi:undecaprenyldiphospho-muramoylpentapeptide beta-N-acetylglucosaminyltransferase [Paenibacillus gansuensis]|uniref:UDP-N-acetylglucosamine--N-acetylmuramyl-(pentapeptide) pyrophosphoryl-undecaprenol N-acetylglucosamine transferase n=1 Tax=Paenibacillus gansuensis TaxID=306542 RepID=A0ABW5PD86_9BACL
MRVVLTGGGTGGHIYPAVAVARQCLKEFPDAEFLYIGTSRGLERDIIPKEGIPFESIEITGFKRKLSLDNVRTVMRFVKGVSRSKELLRKFKPDIVVGTGGYVCGPVVYAAARSGIPTLVHEQNVIPGLTNKFLSRYVSTVAVSFKGSESNFPAAKRAVYTGNPRATVVANADAERGFATLGLPSGSQIVVIVGGSRGARAINEAFMSMLPDIGRFKGTHFVYVTGEAHYEAVLLKIKQTAGTSPSNLHVLPFVYNMPEVLAATSLIVSRAGASFLSEITSLGIPSILIPSPYVTNNHQEANARWMEKEQASVLILEKELNGSTLSQAIGSIVENPGRSESMSSQSLKLGQRDAAQLLLEEMKRLVR